MQPHRKAISTQTSDCQLKQYNLCHEILVWKIQETVFEMISVFVGFQITIKSDEPEWKSYSFLRLDQSSLSQSSNRDHRIWRA